MLAEAPALDVAVETELDPPELLTRLENQAAESGRLAGRVQVLERALKAERDARRRLVERLQRERSAAEALHERAERDRAAQASTAEELERVQQAYAFSQQQLQASWAQLMRAEQQLAWKGRSLRDKLLRRSPNH